MPTASENIFILLREKKYEEVLRLIESDDTLVNAVNERKRSLLYTILTLHTQPSSEALVQFLLMSPNFDFSYNVGLSNLSAMIHSFDLELFECAIKNPNFLVQIKSLPYEGAKRCESALMRRAESEDGLFVSTLPGLIELRDKLDKIQKIRLLLRDVTILHALRTDDRGLMDELDRLGADPTGLLGPLGNNKLPGTLTTPSNVNINAWFEERIAAICAEEEAKKQETAPPTLRQQGIAAAQAKIAELDSQCMQARITAHNRHIQAYLGTRDSQAANPHSFHEPTAARNAENPRPKPDSSSKRSIM